ncbi:transposable element Tc1 transposase [Trichonephila clavipes]|nr:transposable element Tc1 transposase [Trichonephila clavipes]
MTAVKVSDRGWPCHEFEPSTTKDPPCSGAMHVKSAMSSNVLPLGISPKNQFISLFYARDVRQCSEREIIDSQQVQLLPWPAYSPDMSPIEHVWDIVGGRLARDLRPVVSTDELWLRIQTIWNTLPQADIQNLSNSMPRRVAALIAARGGHTKY